MFRSWPSTLLTVLYLISKICVVFGELIILREVLNEGSSNETRHLTCISEDDGGALVWNDDPLYPQGLEDAVFQSHPSLASNPPFDCNLNGVDECHKSWEFNEADWQSSRNLDGPMGPVLDKRWEGFLLKTLEKDMPPYQITSLNNNSVVVFSFHGGQNAHLLLCREFISKGPCYWIIIDGRENASVVRECDSDQDEAECASLTKYNKYTNSSLTLFGWRTFVVNWNENLKTISVFDHEKKILSHHPQKWHPINELYVWNEEPYPVLFRLHSYDYFRTTKADVELLSPKWNYTQGENFCVEMAVGLCPGCHVDISLKYGEGLEDNIKNVTGQRSPVGHGFPMWQFVRLNQNLKAGFQNPIQLRMISRVPQEKKGNHLWAVASVTRCNSAKAIRRSTIITRKVVEDGKSFWPDIRCQKLSHNENSIIKPPSTATVNPREDWCPEGKTGLFCAMTCKDIVGTNNCSGISVCRETGCVCFMGYLVPDCTEPWLSVKNLQIKNITDRKATLEWESDPLDRNENVIEYNVTWKVIRLKGCEKIGEPTPDEKELSETVKLTTATLTDLHPYAKYAVTVRRVPLSRSKPNKKEFNTSFSETPTSVVANLTQVKNTLRWKDPTDCTTITGPIGATKLIFNGISDWVKNITSENVTDDNLIELKDNFYGVTEYKVRAYVTRQPNGTINESAYQELNFTTELQASDAPVNVTAIALENGMVNLTWSYPALISGRLINFWVNVTAVSTELRKNESLENLSENNEIVVSDYYNKEYSKQLSLPPSTEYKFCVLAEVSGTRGPCTTEGYVTQAAMAFKNETFKVVRHTNTTIVITLPSVLYDTRNSTMHVIVKGSTPCEPSYKLGADLIKYVNVTDDQFAWRAASFSNGTEEHQRFTIGNNETYEEVWNCPLKPGQTYEIVIVVQGGPNEMANQSIAISMQSIKTDEEPQTSIPIGLIVTPIVAVAAVASVSGFVVKYRIASSVMQGTLNLHNKISFTERLMNQNPSVSLPNTEGDIPMMSLPPVRKGISSTNNVRTSSQCMYHSPPDGEHSDIVTVIEFEPYVISSLDNGLLARQYSMFPKGKLKSWKYGNLPHNRSKNRFANVIAYDGTRVKLKKLQGDPYSDYINANYIDGYNKKKTYIATQAPMSNTVTDFWRMIWQEDVHVICMLVNVVECLQPKCEQYWPKIGSMKKYGEIVVQNISQSVFADYTYRTFHISLGEETRQIKHLHYTAWPEDGEPPNTYSMVAYLKKLLDTPRGNGPVVVHCCTGIGRTGVIILCDICLQGAAMDDGIYMFGDAMSIREQRFNMVDNLQRYLLAHLAVADYLSTLPTGIPCNVAWPERIKEMEKQLSIQQHRLQEIFWHDQMLQPSNINLPLSKCCLEKNRFPHLAPDHWSSVYISSYPVDDVDSNYIPAVYVDGLQTKNEYLASQLPLPTTIKDFWRLIAELKIELIVLLQEPDLNDSTCCETMPQDIDIEPYPHIKVTRITEIDHEHCSAQKLELIDKSEGVPRKQPVKILKCKGWQPGKDGEPPSADTLVSFWLESRKISRGQGPITVLCYDGVTGCGLYLALSIMLERMIVERECDVYLAVRAVRQTRPQFVQSREQFKYLYDAAVKYAECYETCANFR